MTAAVRRVYRPRTKCVLSDEIAASAQHQGKWHRVIWDSLLPGFGLRLSQSGEKSWILRLGGKSAPSIRSFGHPPEMTVAAARVIVRQRISDHGTNFRCRGGQFKVRRLPDPFPECPEPEPGTLAAAFLEYVQREGTASTPWRQKIRLFQRTLLPLHAARPLNEISWHDIREILSPIIEQHSKQYVGNISGAFSSFFEWSINRGLLEDSPMMKLRNVPEPMPSGRTLDDIEIIKFWNGCNQIGWPFGPMLQLLLTTAQRPTEVAGMRWDELELTAKLWDLPAGRTKSRRPHLNPLSDLSRDIIAAQPKFSPLVFTIDGIHPVSGYHRSKERIVKLTGVENWVAYDLRRTAATWMASLDIDFPVVEKILNHRTRHGSNDSIFTRYELLDERRVALEAWGEKLATLVHGPVGQ